MCHGVYLLACVSWCVLVGLCVMVCTCWLVCHGVYLLACVSWCVLVGLCVMVCTCWVRTYNELPLACRGVVDGTVSTIPLFDPLIFTVPLLAYALALALL